MRQSVSGSGIDGLTTEEFEELDVSDGHAFGSYLVEFVGITISVMATDKHTLIV